MVEESAGCFIKVSKNSKLPVTRYFIVDPSTSSLKYFDNSAQLRRVLNKKHSLDQALCLLENPKILDLKPFKLGPKTLNNFSILNKTKELTFFPWNKESVDMLYEKVAEILSKNSEGMKGGTSCTENDLSGEKTEMTKLENGNMYCGEFNEEGLPHGNSGREFCEDGSIYYGSFRRGKWHGSGCIINSNLDMVHKEYIQGELCGI